MSFWPTVLGAAIGLLIAFCANIFVLPVVIRKQQEQSIKAIWTPFGQLDIATANKFAYRIAMPIVFAVALAVGANNLTEGVAP